MPHRLPFFQSTGLRTLLLWTLGIVYLISFLITAVGLAVVIYQDERTAWRERHTEASQAAATTLTMFLDQARQTLITVGELEHDDGDALSRSIEHLLARDESASLLEVVRVDEQGRLLGSAHRDTSVLADLFTIPQSNWFKIARMGDKYVGSVQVSANGAPYLVIAVPSPDHGVVAARLDMRILWDLVANIRFGRTGSTYILTESGRMLAHPEPAFVRANTSLDKRPELMAFRHVQGQAREKAWSDIYVNFQGDRVAGVITRLPSTTWIVVTEIRTSEVYGRTQRAVLVLAGGMLLFGSIVMLIMRPILDRMLFAPLEQVRWSAERIGHGHLDQYIAVGWRNEIGQVAASFNEMAARLRERDAEIAAHTAALAAAQARLQHLITESPVVIYCFQTDPAYVTTFVTTNTESVLGYAAERFTSEPDFWYDHVHPEDRSVVDEALSTIHETGYEVIEYRFLYGGGAYRWIHEEMRPLSGSEGRREVVGSCIDITDRKAAEQRLEIAHERALQASRLKSEFEPRDSHTHEWYCGHN